MREYQPGDVASAFFQVYPPLEVYDESVVDEAPITSEAEPEVLTDWRDQEGFIIGIGCEDQLNAPGWQRNLAAQYAETGLEFAGNTGEAATCLARLSEGARFAFSTMQPDWPGAEALDTPAIKIIPDAMTTPEVVAASQDSGLICVNGRRLEAYSMVDPDAFIAVASEAGETLFEGTARDYFYLEGIGTAADAIAGQLGGSTASTYYQEDGLLAARDATDEGWYKLNWQRWAAQDQQLPLETQAVLNARFEAAEALRRRLG